MKRKGALVREFLWIDQADCQSNDSQIDSQIGVHIVSLIY